MELSPFGEKNSSPKADLTAEMEDAAAKPFSLSEPISKLWPIYVRGISFGLRTDSPVAAINAMAGMALM